MKQIFDNYIGNSYEGEVTQSEFKIEQFGKNYKKYFPANQTGMKVLDIGIGRGEMLSCFKKWGFTNYLGIDITMSTISLCKNLGLTCEYTEDTIAWLNNHKNSFDRITLFDVVEHIKKDEVLEFLAAVRGALKEGGITIMQTPNMQSNNPNLHRWGDITHEFELTESSFRQIINEAGYSHASFYGFEWITGNTMRNKVLKMVRAVIWKLTRFGRRLTGNLNPEILHPIFFCCR
jgi:2-polyprenyl-3-methyl-5-hydroxy-6-metoxy-1,4-benzoquinol methylase